MYFKMKDQIAVLNISRNVENRNTYFISLDRESLPIIAHENSHATEEVIYLF